MSFFKEQDYDGPLPAGINPENTLKIFNESHNFYYKVAFSIEEMLSKNNKESVWLRHFSVSTSFNDCPNDSIMYLLPSFGFRSTDKNDLLFQTIPPIIHILEPMDTTWAEL